MLEGRRHRQPSGRGAVKVSVDVHFGYGAVGSFTGAVGLLTGLYVNESISFPVLICMTASYVGFHFAAMWVHHAHQVYREESVLREYQEDQYLQSVLEHEPLELLPAEMELSSLRR